MGRITTARDLAIAIYQVICVVLLALLCFSVAFVVFHVYALDTRDLDECKERLRQHFGRNQEQELELGSCRNAYEHMTQLKRECDERIRHEYVHYRATAKLFTALYRSACEDLLEFLNKIKNVQYGF